MKDYHDYSPKLSYSFKMPDHLQSEPLRQIENDIPRAFWCSPESLSTLCEISLRKTLQAEHFWNGISTLLPPHQRIYLRRDLYLKETFPVGVSHFEKLSNKLQRPKFPYIRFTRNRPITKISRNSSQSQRKKS